MTPDISQFLQELQDKGLIYLSVKVIPKWCRTELVDIFMDEEGHQTLKIKLKAAPEKGKANRELIEFLSNLLNTPKSNITIVSGQTSRKKIIKITK